MPELPEVETIRRGLVNLTEKKVVKIFRSEKKLRIESSLNLQGLIGATVFEITRRARYLIIHFSNKKSLIIHLGMSGKLLHAQSHNSEKYQKHDHFICEFDDGSCLVFNDPRRFGFVDLVAEKDLKNHRMLSRLALEPLDSKFDHSYLQKKLLGKKMNIKTSMMDNQIVVGVGNIYINESLFDAKILPLRNACDINMSELKKLVSSIKKIIAKAIDLGGSSISDYVTSSGDLGKFQNNFKVYGRERGNCLICKDTIQKIKQNGRSTFFCPTCQK